MANARRHSVVIVPAVEEVREERIVLELTEDEARRIYDISAQLASGDAGLPNVYKALQGVFGGFGAGNYRLSVDNSATPRLNRSR